MDKELLNTCTCLSDIARIIYGKANYTNSEKVKQDLKSIGVDWKEWLESKKKHKYCLFCGKELSGKQSKYCSKDCKNKYFDKNVRADYSRVKGRNIKWQLIKLSGGKCAKCGYNKNMAALSFHHINPSEKLFELEK